MWSRQMSDYEKVEGLVKVRKKKVFKIQYVEYTANKKERLYEAWDVVDAMDGITRDIEKEFKDTDNFIEVNCVEEDK